MQAKSPLFISAIELLAHSTELFSKNDEKKFKFIILHLANSVELILKEKLLSKGHSIFVTKTAKTITFWEAVQQLNHLKIELPEKAFLELLVDDRNSIQHKFGFPNRESVFYYIQNVMAFFKRFLIEEFSMDLLDELRIYLSDAELAIIGLTTDELFELHQLKKVSIDLAIIKSFIYIETEFRDLSKTGYKNSMSKHITPRSNFLIPFLIMLKSKEYIQTSLEDINDFIQIRNLITHGIFDVNASNSHKIIDAAYHTGIELVEGLEKAKKEGFFDNFDWDTIF